MGGIAIVDYGIGNSGSIRNMLSRIGVSAVITGDPMVIVQADRLILPGVGAFDSAMHNLRSRGLVDVLTDVAMRQKKPILGICLGMQVMTNGSEEGNLPGLGWIDAQTIRFRFGPDAGRMLVPHMGWNVATPRKHSPVWTGLPEQARFYFVHSYHVQCSQQEDVLTVTDYGIPFTSSFARDNLYGVQFHPEKSHKYGMALLKSFALNT